MGTTTAPSHEVDAMDKRLIVWTLDSSDCNVHSELLSFSESPISDRFQPSVQKAPDLEAGLLKLAAGDSDLLAMPASIMRGNEALIAESGCSVIGARSPRRPNLVLVSPNRLFYQPKSAIIVSDSNLVRRQFMRARPDLTVISPDDVKTGARGKKAPSDDIDRARWLGQMLDSGIIDGFVISRAEYENSGQTERRHTLMTSSQERGGPHFLPKPYSDLIVIVARRGFPKAMADLVTEPEGNTVLWIQSRILGSLDEDLFELLGIQVRHRQVGSLIREAEEEKDLVMLDACHNPEGEVKEDEVRVEVRMEIISADGRRTLELHRLIPRSEFQHATISLLRDWGQLLAETSREVPRDHPSDALAPPFIQLHDS